MSYQFIQARNYTVANRKTIDLLVIHTMEAPEKPDTAENVAKWFAGPTAPQASAHYCVDNDSIVQCVKDKDVAWHAPGANHNGLGIEHAGTAKQSTLNWSDAYSQAMLGMSARLAAEKCKQYDIPVVRLRADQLKAGLRGLTGHIDCTEAFGGTHTDPGPNFPWGRYLQLVTAVLHQPHVGDKVSGTELSWREWYLGEGRYAGRKQDPAVRPGAPTPVPKAWWDRLDAFLLKRA